MSADESPDAPQNAQEALDLLMVKFKELAEKTFREESQKFSALCLNLAKAGMGLSFTAIGHDDANPDDAKRAKALVIVLSGELPLEILNDVARYAMASSQDAHPAGGRVIYSKGAAAFGMSEPDVGGPDFAPPSVDGEGEGDQ
jgi:hypothetical protein